MMDLNYKQITAENLETEHICCAISEKKGLVILSSHKKRPFLADPGYLKYKGFLVADTAEPYFELRYLPFEPGHEVPKFKPYAKEGTIKEKGLVLYYTNQCPHTDKYAPVLEAAAKEKGMKVTLIKIACTQDAQNAPSPFTTYSLFLDGHFLTNEILSEKSFDKLLRK